MSLTPEQNIKGFIALITDQPSVFLAENRMDLEQQIDTFSEESFESLSDDISTWCRKYPDIRKALRKTIKNLFGSTPKNDRGQAESNPKPKPKDYKTDIKNKMRENFRETNKEQKLSDSSK